MSALRIVIASLTLASVAAADDAPARRARLGVATVDISADLRAHFGAATDRGVLVDRVTIDGPAAKAGVEVGDVIVELGGDATRSTAELRGEVRDHQVGDQVEIVVIRNNQRLELHALLDDVAVPFEDLPRPSLSPGFGLAPREQLDIEHLLDRMQHELHDLEHSIQARHRA
jgi:S1-C subfamily serine protease